MASHHRVHERAQQHTTRPNHRPQRDRLVHERNRQNGLNARLRRPTDVVRQRRRQLDLQDRHNTDQKPEQSCQRHQCPEEEGSEIGSVLGNDVSFKEKNQWDEENRTVHIVLRIRRREDEDEKAQLPTVVVHDGNHLLGEDAIERDEQRRAHAEEGARQRKVNLTFASNVETKDHDRAANDHGQRRHNMQKEIGKNHVKHDCQRTRN